MVFFKRDFVGQLGQKRLIKGALACAFALMLSGCVTIPDAIKGSSPTPQQDLVRVM
ncbi:hypothetical protein MJM45_30080, partial [Salmonella enterica subsp. enterica serovar Kentucky]|nr:hypothetical protein [Salmonella enterica subsp. enterica serovar Kentucky]